MVIIGKNLYLCKRNNQKIYYYMFTNEDLKQLASKGISQEQVKDQLERFVTGFPYLRLSDSAKLGKSIFGLSTEEEEQAKYPMWWAFLLGGIVLGGGVGSAIPIAIYSNKQRKEDEMRL